MSTPSVSIPSTLSNQPNSTPAPAALHKKRKPSSPAPSLCGGSECGDDDLSGSARGGGGQGERIGLGTGPGEVNEPGISVSESRRRARVLRNRASAQRSRDAKKNHQSALEERVQELEALLTLASIPIPAPSFSSTAPIPPTAVSSASTLSSPTHSSTTLPHANTASSTETLAHSNDLETENIDLRTRVSKLESLIRGLVGFLERQGIRSSSLHWNSAETKKEGVEVDSFPTLDLLWNGPELVQDQTDSYQPSSQAALPAPALSDFTFSPPSSPFGSSCPSATMDSPEGSPKGFHSLSPSSSPTSALFPSLSSNPLDSNLPSSPDYASFLNLPSSQGSPVLEPIPSFSLERPPLPRNRRSVSSASASYGTDDFLHLSPMSIASDGLVCSSSPTPTTPSSSVLGLEACPSRNQSTVTKPAVQPTLPKASSSKARPCLTLSSPVSPVSLPPSVLAMPPSPLVLSPSRASAVPIACSSRKLAPPLKRLPSIILNTTHPVSPTPTCRPWASSPGGLLRVKSTSSLREASSSTTPARSRTTARSGLGRGSRFLNKVLQGPVLPSPGGAPKPTGEPTALVSATTKLEIIPAGLSTMLRTGSPRPHPPSRMSSRSPGPFLVRTNSNPLLTLPELKRMASGGSAGAGGSAWLVKRDEMNTCFGAIGLATGRTAAAC